MLVVVRFCEGLTGMHVFANNEMPSVTVFVRSASFAAEFGFFNGLENFANGTLGSWRIRNILIEKRQKALTAQNCGDSI